MEDKEIKFKVISKYLHYHRFIQNINLERIRVKKIALIENDMVVVCSSELREQQKVLSICSPVCFVNKSHLFSLGLMLISPENTLVFQHVLPPLSEFHVPIDLVNNNLKFYSIQKNPALNGQSNQMNLFQLLQYPHNSSMDIRLDRETVVMNIDKQAKGKGKTRVLLESPV